MWPSTGTAYGREVGLETVADNCVELHGLVEVAEAVAAGGPELETGNGADFTLGRFGHQHLAAVRRGQALGLVHREGDVSPPRGEASPV